jgi:glycosyltransferase involved in cell wall biosynthesis
MKGVDHTIQAVARLADRYPDLRYRIIGKGSDKPRLMQLAQSSGLGERVVFEQDLTDEQLVEAYARCTAYVMPSGQEGFGIVFLEAMRYAKPCIGGDAGGTPEVIEDGRTGFLVPFGDVDRLVTALDALLGDADLRHRLGEAGRARLLERFTFDRFRDRLEGYLRELLPRD